MKGWAVVASVAGTTAGFTIEEARHMAQSLEEGLEACPDLPIRETVERLVSALRESADRVEELTNGVRQ